MNSIQSFNRTMDYIERTLDTELDEKEIARLSSYSYPLFSRIFSILVGYPLNELTCSTTKLSNRSTSSKSHR